MPPCPGQAQSVEDPAGHRHGGPACRLPGAKAFAQFAALPPQTLDNAISQWTGQHRAEHAPVAMDGKDLRGASKQTDEARRIIGPG